MVEQGVLGVLRILCWVDPVDCGPRGVWRDVLICGGRVRIMSKHQVVGDCSSHRCCGRRCGLLLPLRLLILTTTLPEEQEAVAVPLNRVVGHVHVHLDLVAHPFPQIADSGHTAKQRDLLYFVFNSVRGVQMQNKLYIRSTCTISQYDLPVRSTRRAATKVARAIYLHNSPANMQHANQMGKNKCNKNRCFKK